MSEDVEKKKVSLDTIKDSLANLKYKVSEFQERIEEYLSSVDELWRDAKSLHEFAFQSGRRCPLPSARRPR